MDIEIFRSYEYLGAEPYLPQKLLWEMREGAEIVRIDEEIYNFVYRNYATLRVFELADRFGIRVSPMGRPLEMAEFFCQGDEFYLRPPKVVEN
jgi:hypothetical protein